MNKAITLTPTMAKALALLDRARYLPGVLYNGESLIMDGQAWINWQSAEALERRGLVRILRIDDGGDVYPVKHQPAATSPSKSKAPGTGKKRGEQ